MNFLSPPYRQDHILLFPEPAYESLLTLQHAIQVHCVQFTISKCSLEDFYFLKLMSSNTSTTSMIRNFKYLSSLFSKAHCHINFNHLFTIRYCLFIFFIPHLSYSSAWDVVLVFLYSCHLLKVPCLDLNLISN